MKRLLQFALLLAALLPGARPLAAATPTLTGTQCVQVGRSVTCRWFTSEPGSSTRAQLAFDFEGDNIDWVLNEGQVGDGSSTLRALEITSVPLNSDVWLIPRSRDGTSNWSSDFQCPSLTCTNCGSGNHAFFADSSGLDCSPGAYPKLHTSAADPACGSPPCTPAAPTHSGLTACPAITGTSRTVLGDGSDFLERFNDAKAAAAAGTVEEIVVPAGVAIRPENQTGAPARFTLDNIANGGWVVIRPDSDPKLLPPAGTQIDPSYWPHMGHIQFNTDPTDNDRGTGLIWDGSPADRGYCLKAIHHAPPPVGELVTVSVAVTAINTSTDVLTASSLAGLQNEMVVMVDLSASGVGTSGYPSWVGPRRICNISGNTFQLTGLSTGQNFCGVGMIDLTGSNCASNCGTLVHWIAKPVEAISNTTPVTITVTNHGLVNFPALTINGSTASTNVTVSDSTIFSSGTAVYVSGTGSGTCDGLWKAGTVSGSTIPLTPAVGASTPANCTGVTSGAIRRVMAISLVGTSDADLGQYRPVNHPFLVTDANTVTLLGTTAQGTVTGGVLYFETETLTSWIRISASFGETPGSDFVCDRCSFYLPPWFRQGTGINVSRMERFSFVNSWLEASFWSRINPVNGVEEAITDRLADDSYTSILFSMGHDVQILNSMFLPQPFLFTDTPSAPGTQNVTVHQNILFQPDWAIQSHDDFGGFKHSVTFFLEFKDCDTCRFTGNYGKGFFSVRNQSESWIEFSGIGRSDTTYGRTGDVTISHNTMERGGGCIHITADNTERENIHTANERFLIEHNLCVELDTNQYNGTGSLNSGRFVRQAGGIVDLIVRRNTYWPWRAWRPAFWEFSGNWGQGADWQNNILLATEGGFTEEIGVKGSLSNSGRSPAPSQDAGQAAMSEFFRSGNLADSLTKFTSNVIISGIESSPSGSLASKWSSTDDSDTISRAEAEAKAQLDMTGNTFVGSATACSGGTCPDSLATREATVFETGLYVPKTAYNGEGADIGAVEDTQGWVSGIVVSADNDEVTVAYHAPTATGCWVDLAPWNTSWAVTWSSAGSITRKQDASAAQAQSVQFTPLIAETQYAYRVHCAKSAIGQATTAGSP